MARDILGRRFWLKYGPLTINRARKQLFIDGIMVNGQPYPDYKPGYAKAKATGKLFRQATQFKDKVTPILTGDLMRDFKLHKSSKTGFQTGFVAWGSKVESLAKKGRFLTTKHQPLPRGAIEYLETQARWWVEADLRKRFNKTTVIKVKAGK